MSRSYSLDTNSAKQAGASNYINETGPYVGTMTRAEDVRSKQQTEGIEFTFLSDDGRTCDYLTLWTYNASGEPLYGLKKVNALMTCMKVKTMEPKTLTLKDRDGSQRQATCYPDLMQKPIGVLLQREEYAKNDGSIGYKFNIVGCYEASSGMTASEILDRAAKPEQMAKWAAQLKDRPMQKRPASGGTSHAITAPPSTFADMDDSDIPF